MCFKGQSIHGYIRPLNLIGSKVTKKFTIKLHMRLLSYFINFITFLSIFHIEILKKTRRIGLMSSNHRLNLFSKLNDDSPNNSLFSEKNDISAVFSERATNATNTLIRCLCYFARVTYKYRTT